LLAGGSQSRVFKALSRSVTASPPPT
jgi:hypothetical protein